jgi:probable phosphomutase (TIGR03848 family)
MATVFFVRHGRTDANVAGVLAGRSAVGLDARGRSQAAAAGRRLRAVPIQAVVTSPLNRTRQTAAALVEARSSRIPVKREPGFQEIDYGQWSGRSLAELAQEDLWPVVQRHPSAVTFPDGESMAAMQHRAVASIRHWNARYPRAYAIVSHGDVIKAVLADALGMHLDQFQRLVIDPGSISAVHYAPERPFVLATNVTHGGLDRLTRKLRSSDAVVGGRA